MKFKSNEEGRCPICNSENLDYHAMELEGVLGNSVAFPWHCNDCGTNGKEWYYLEYNETVSTSGATIEEPEICPDCGMEINYVDSAYPEGESLGYAYECTECNGTGYEWYDMSFDSHTIDGHEGEDIELVKEAIDYKNNKITVTTAEDPKDDREYYGRNMTKRDKVRSLDQAKRNLDRMEKDPRVTQGQAIDQVSFDSALDTDLARYKHNKDMAKIDKAQGNDFWADEHNKTAKQFADKIRAKHKKQEDVDSRDIENLKQNIANKVADDMVKAMGKDNVTGMDRQTFFNNIINSLGTEKGINSILADYKDGTSNRDIRITTDLNTLKSKLFSSKKQEDIDNDEEENDTDLLDTISLLDIALSEIPTTGVEDWGKDDELLFVADTKVLFENLKSYEHKIPRSYYDNAGNDDWSNGIDKYLEDKFNVDIENGESDNTYNWNAPLTHDVEFTVIQAGSKCFFKASIHRAGDVRGNYTTEFLLEFSDKDDCYEAIFDACSENCCNEVTLDGINYVIEPHFFNSEVDIYNAETGENYDDVYCTCIEDLKEIIATEESGDYL